MKYRRTPQFREDYDRFDQAGKMAIQEAFRTVALALEGDAELFRHHRIKVMEGTGGNIWEGHVKQNICFTFHYDKTEDGEKVCFFRRIGTHEIYGKP